MLSIYNLKQRQSLPAIVVSLAMLTNTVTPLIEPALAQSMFYDLHNNWAKSCIIKLANAGIINGYPDGSFRPNLSMNRAEFATIVVKVFPKTSPTQQSIKFVDVPNYHWAYDQATEAAKRRFLSGYPGNFFKPNQKISRSQVLVALVSGLNYYPTQAATTTLKVNFIDANAIPVYAQNKIAAATEKRLVVNYPDVKFLNPNQNATRAEVAAFLCQALVNSSETAVIPQQYVVGGAAPRRKDAAIDCNSLMIAPKTPSQAQICKSASNSSQSTSDFR